MGYGALEAENFTKDFTSEVSVPAEKDKNSCDDVFVIRVLYVGN